MLTGAQRPRLVRNEELKARQDGLLGIEELTSFIMYDIHTVEALAQTSPFAET